MYEPLPKEYAWLADEEGPRVLREALKQHGLREDTSAKSNPVILDMALQLGLGGVYKSDGIAWCGLGMAYWVHKATFTPVRDPLWALNWQNFGEAADTPMLGDVMVFARPGGGHVGLYVGDSVKSWHVLGANQSDMVCVRTFPKIGGALKLRAVRRCPWRFSQPSNVRRVRLADTGVPVSGVT